MSAHFAGDIVGGRLAFILAAAATYLDCYQVVRGTTWRVPQQFWRSWGLFGLAFACGCLATTAFIFSIWGDGGYLETLLGSSISNHVIRGLYTGLAVLALLRSKVFQVRDVDVGIEYAYVEFRAYCLSGVSIEWTTWRNDFVNRRLRDAMGRLMSDDSFDSQLAELIRAAVQNADDKTRTSVVSQLSDVVSRKPSTVPDVADRAWAAYCRAMLNLTLENCGSKPLIKLFSSSS